MDALARAATSVNPTADSGYPPPLPLSAASSIAAFKAEDFERSATALLRTLNLDCKTVISKELEAFSVNGTPLPKAAVEAIAVVHFNRGSGSISFTAGVEALTAYEHLLGPLPVSVFRAQVAQFMVNDAQLVLELAQTDAKTIAPSSNVPSTTRSFTMDFANSLFLQRMAEDIFGAHKQANKSLPRASMTAPLLIIQPGAQVRCLKERRWRSSFDRRILNSLTWLPCRCRRLCDNNFSSGWNMAPRKKEVTTLRRLRRLPASRSWVLLPKRSCLLASGYSGAKLRYTPAPTPRPQQLQLPLPVLAMQI